MSKIHEEITANGLSIPGSILQQWGWYEGTKVVIETHNKSIVIKPQELTENEISKLACIFLLKKVGDAVAIKKPIRDGNKWRVTVVLPHQKRDLGQLVFAVDGTLLQAESDTPEDLSRRADEYQTKTA